MKTLVRAAIATIIVAIALTLLSAPRVNAVEPAPYDRDVRPCATAREVWLLGKPFTRAEVERRWETTGLGFRGATMIGPAWVYPLCDDRGDGIERVAIAVFEADGRAWAYGITRRAEVTKIR